MTCCGKKRAAFHETPPTRRSIEPVEKASIVPKPTQVDFEYLGGTVMTVVGPVTGKSYRFVGYGARVKVDPRDRLSLSSVPNLRPVKNGNG